MASITMHVCGFLAKDPEYFPAKGKKESRCKLVVPVDQGEDETVWVHATAWGSAADFAGEYLKKGSGVAMRGSFRAWEHEGSMYWGLSVHRLDGLGERRTRDPEDGGDNPPQRRGCR